MDTKEKVRSVDYHKGRLTRRALSYRLARRTSEVQRAVRRYERRPIRAILDIGTADAMMLKRLQPFWPEARCVGLDLSRELLLASLDPGIFRVEANGVFLPFADNTFNLVIATAIIEHVTEPRQMVSEMRRVLIPGGLCIITTPDPFFERIATYIGHLDDEGHNLTFNLEDLSQLMSGCDLQVLESSKFMMSPWGFPGELTLEQIIQNIGFRFLLLNQLVVARK